jgi:hypothetical protein
MGLRERDARDRAEDVDARGRRAEEQELVGPEGAYLLDVVRRGTEGRERGRYATTSIRATPRHGERFARGLTRRGRPPPRQSRMPNFRAGWMSSAPSSRRRYLQSTTCEPIGIGPSRVDEAGVRVLPE